MKLSIRQLTINAVVAAIYFVVTIFLPSYGALQLRLSELFAHLPVFHRKYTVGLIIGVALANIRSEFGIFDVVFGTLHTVISIWIVSKLIRETDSILKKLVMNSVVFAGMSFMLAFMVGMLTEQLSIFWILYGSFAISILVVMLATIPVILILDKRVDFKKVMTDRAKI